MFTCGRLTSGCVCLQEVLDLAFSITYDVEEYSLNFIAPSRTDVSLQKPKKPTKTRPQAGT